MALTFTLKLARFLAKRLNLAGGSELEQAEVDMYGDQVCFLYFSNISQLFYLFNLFQNEKLD